MAELTRKSHGPEFWAKRDGTCKRCGGEIVKDESVLVVVDGLGACHAACGKSYCETINEHLDEDAA